MAVKSFYTQARSVDGISNESGAKTTMVRFDTSTPVAGYSNPALSAQVTNPQVATSLGLCGPIYWDDAVEPEVTFTVRTSDNATVLLQVAYKDGTFQTLFARIGNVVVFSNRYTSTGLQTLALSGIVIDNPYAIHLYIDGIIAPKNTYSVVTDGTNSTITWATNCQPSTGTDVYYESATFQALSPAVTDYAGVDISAASVTPTGGSADTLADHLAAKLTSSGGDGSEVVVTPDGATVGRSLENWAGDVFNVKAGWGGAAAVGDGAADDAAAINRAITACNAAGGGIVEIPKGTYILETVGSSQTIVMMSNVWLRGAGQGVTILKIKNGAESHGPNCQGLSNFRITDLSVDGNRANNVNTSCHGIRIGGTGLTNNNGYLARLEIYNACHYNIGIQGGTNKHIIIQDIELYGSGADGLDVKNIEDNNEDIFISNIRVRTWAQAAGTAQAAIDLRGTVHLSGVRIQDPTQDDAVGLRFRQGEALDANGIGAHRSTATGLYIDLGTKPDAQGVVIAARDVAISNGYIRGGQDGVAVLDSGARLTAITVEDALDDGFYLQAAGAGLDADAAVLTACVARGCTDNGFRVDTDRVQLIGCEATGNDDGVLIAAGADGTQIIGGSYTGNTTSQISDLGTNTKVRLGSEAQPGYVEYAADATWSKPVGLKSVYVQAIGGGGGGGGGARVASGTACSGGGGGGGGGFSDAWLDAADLASTESVVIGLAGSSGAGATSDGTAGSNGTAGGTTSFGTSINYVRGNGGGRGAGGQVSAASGGGGGAGVHGAGGDATTSTGGTAGSTGGAAGGSGVAGNGNTGFGSAGGAGCASGALGLAVAACVVGCGGGGSGAGLATVPVSLAGGDGGRNMGWSASVPAGGAAALPGTSPAAKSRANGVGGGGGGSNASGVGGAGGTGGFAGGGGGGGGAGLGANGGAGGGGGAGIVRIWHYY